VQKTLPTEANSRNIPNLQELHKQSALKAAGNNSADTQKENRRKKNRDPVEEFILTANTAS
jgi:hypothetical protein